MQDNVQFPYPKSLNIKLWESYLGRNLNDEEYSIFIMVKGERSMNNEIKYLNNKVSKKNLYIPELTNCDGNCLFESLKILQIHNDEDELRKFVSKMMYIFADYKNIFNFDQRTLREMFNDTNEIEYVICNGTYEVFKYTYETMCQDLASDNSWTRLPTQLIMMFISVIFNCSITVFHSSSGYVNTINANSELDENEYEKIYLGLLGEKHYVPLETKDKECEYEIPEYSDALDSFIIWAQKMQEQINKKLCNRKTRKNKIVNFDNFRN